MGGMHTSLFIGSRQQAAGSRQQAAGSRQQAAGSRQQAAGSRQQAAGSRPFLAISKKHAQDRGWSWCFLLIFWHLGSQQQRFLSQGSCTQTHRSRPMWLVNRLNLKHPRIPPKRQGCSSVFWQSCSSLTMRRTSNCVKQLRKAIRHTFLATWFLRTCVIANYLQSKKFISQ